MNEYYSRYSTTKFVGIYTILIYSGYELVAAQKTRDLQVIVLASLVEWK